MRGAQILTPWLEWGEGSTMPRSAVRDADGVLVFTGSPVVSTEDADRDGWVTNLIDADRISVAWADDSSRPQQVAARRVRVTGPFRSEVARDLRPDAWTGEGWKVDPFLI
jgi:hypothetical protein